MNSHVSATDFLSVKSSAKPSARAQFVERRTYLRPTNDEGTVFETPSEALDRVIGHQRWLWETQAKANLTPENEAELARLRQLIEDGKVSMSGRVKWMGGTDIIKERASAAFNCSFTTITTPADMVDAFWLLLQGCGVGFKPINGLMTGLPSTIKYIAVVPSTRTDKGGAEDNTSIIDYEKSTWTIKIGDSAKGWSKALGTLLTEKPRVETLVIDLSELRPGGKRLRGYGWLSSGWEPLAKSFEGIARILINRADQLLTAIDIGDIVNWLGTVLSSRRSAQIWVMDDFHPEVEDFIGIKVDRWERGQGQREQSNNSVGFHRNPGPKAIRKLLETILASGDPGFVNMNEARRRAPEMEGFNPCAEILLPSKGFCNLVQVAFHRFNGDQRGLLEALHLAGRANYRQTCVSMKDGVLQLQWNDNQRILRLCGVAPTGYVAWTGMNNPEMLREAANAAREGAYSMADEFGTPRPRRVTQVQPAGTVSKVMGREGDEVHEGAHLALSRWIFNNIGFSVYDDIVEVLRKANYDVKPHPTDPTSVLVKFPVEYPDSPMFTHVEKEIDGVVHHMEVNQESAISQLERYRILMENYVDHNCSITVSFDENEIPEMADWFDKNWDKFVGVSFLKRNNPLATAEDLGFKYLPQECVSRETYQAYVANLLPVDLSLDHSANLLDMADCSTGACPIR